jgi:DNA invertase Pin-like site-specific DNA recombinase
MTEKDPPSRLIGYARVSTYGQTLDAQLGQLKAAGCARIYREKATGARADRKELLKMLRQLAAGDVVVVTRIDRLARSTFDLSPNSIATICSSSTTSPTSPRIRQRPRCSSS